MTAMREDRFSSARDREIGDVLRQARRAAQLRSKDVAEATGLSRTTISHLESGVRTTANEELMLLIGYCRASKDVQARMRTLLQEKNTGYLVRPHEPCVPESLRTLILHEQMATTLCKYESIFVPGLLQTPDYARAIMSVNGGAVLDRWVDLRVARQRMLSSREAPAATFYIHEAALHAKVGDSRIMRDQMLKLALMCGWRRLTLRLVPFSGGARAMLSGSFAVLGFEKLSTMVFAEGPIVTLVIEDPESVGGYRAIEKELAGLALSQEESRSVFAEWADWYDREEPDGPPRSRLA